MARDRLVDREQPQLAAVLLAQVRLALLVGPVVGHGRDGEEAVEASVERAWRDEHRPAEGPQERRGPDDLQGLLREAHEVALPDEGLDALVLRAAVVEQLVARGMV